MLANLEPVGFVLRRMLLQQIISYSDQYVRSSVRFNYFSTISYKHINLSMNKLQKMHRLLKQSKKLDIVQLLNKKHLYKTQAKQKNTQSLTKHSKNQLYYSVVYLSPQNDEVDQKWRARSEKRDKSTSIDKKNSFFTPLVTFREHKRMYLENVRNVSQILTQTVPRSARFNEIEWDGGESERQKTPKTRCHKNHLKKIGQNVFVMKPKAEKKMSEVRIRKAKKTQQQLQSVQTTEQVFRLCGWETINEEEYIQTCS